MLKKNRQFAPGGRPLAQLQKSDAMCYTDGPASQSFSSLPLFTHDMKSPARTTLLSRRQSLS